MSRPCRSVAWVIFFQNYFSNIFVDEAGGGKKGKAWEGEKEGGRPTRPPEGARCTTAQDANVEGGRERINSTYPARRAGLGEPLRSSG